MPDVFDRIVGTDAKNGRGDVFDRVSARGEQVVKDWMDGGSNPLIRGAKGFLSYINPLPLAEELIRNPMSGQLGGGGVADRLVDTRGQFRSAAEAFARAIPGGNVEPSVMDPRSRMDHAVEGAYKAVAAIPVVGPIADAMTQDLSSTVKSGDLAGATGKVAGAVLGPKVLKEAARPLKALAPALQAGAESRYAKIFDKATDAQKVERVVPELINRRVTLRDPKAELPAMADADAPVLPNGAKVIPPIGPFNAPGVKPLNREAGLWQEAKDLGKGSPASQTIGEVARQGAMEAMERALLSLIHKEAGAVLSGSKVAQTLYRIAKTPQFRTASAVLQADFANAVNAGKLQEAAAIGGQIMRAGAVGGIVDEQKKQLESQMRQRSVDYPTPDDMTEENERYVMANHPSRILPEKFKSARSMGIGMPIREGATDKWDFGGPESTWSGLYGRGFSPEEHANQPPYTYDSGLQVSRGPANNALISKKAVDDGNYASTLMHETGHSAWMGGDVTKDEKQSWNALHSEELAGGNAHPAISYYSNDPSHSYAELFGEYIAAPLYLEKAQPRIYAWFKNHFGGKEYKVAANAALYQQRRDGIHVEWPAHGSYDENDAMLMRRKDASGKDMQFPTPVLPSTLLPPKFANARNIAWGSPYGRSMGDNSNLRGGFGEEFNASKRATQAEPVNTAQIASDSADVPGTYVHELGHSMWQFDLPEGSKDRAAFTSMFRQLVTEWRTEAQRAVLGQPPERRKAAIDAVTSRYPRSIINNFVVYQKDPNRAVHEAFAETFAQYMLNPSAFKRAYPALYEGMHSIVGAEYIGGKPRFK